VPLGPSPRALKLPPIDDITIEDELATLRELQEVIYFANLAVRRPEMDVGKDDGLDLEFSHGHLTNSYAMS
jgi:hypothetical protein